MHNGNCCHYYHCLTAPTERQMCRWSTAFFIGVFALTCSTVEMVEIWMCCLQRFDLFHWCLFAGWNGFVLLALPPFLLSSSSVDYGNVIMHGNISKDGYYGKRKVNWWFILSCFLPCSSSFSACLVLPGLFSLVWSAVNVRSPGGQ